MVKNTSRQQGTRVGEERNGLPRSLKTTLGGYGTGPTTAAHGPVAFSITNGMCDKRRRCVFIWTGLEVPICASDVDDDHVGWPDRYRAGEHYRFVLFPDASSPTAIRAIRAIRSAPEWEPTAH